MKTVLLVSLLCLSPFAFAGEAAAISESTAPAAETVSDASSDKPATKQRCERRKALGSNIAKRECFTVTDDSEAKDRAQADLARYGRCSGNETACRPDL